MWNSLKGILLLVLLPVCIAPQDCKCVITTSEDSTRHGGNQLVTFVEKRTFEELNGIVLDVNGTALEGVLVELFDQPEWIKNDGTPRPTNQKRLHACVTAKDGRFCFPKLAKGNYELRVSRDAGWNPSFIFVRIDPKASRARKKPIEVLLTVGT